MKLLALVLTVVMVSDASVSPWARRRLADELEARIERGSWEELADRVNSWDGQSDKKEIWKDVKETLDSARGAEDETQSIYEDASRTLTLGRLLRAYEDRVSAQFNSRCLNFFFYVDFNKDTKLTPADVDAFEELINTKLRKPQSEDLAALRNAWVVAFPNDQSDSADKFCAFLLGKAASASDLATWINGIFSKFFLVLDKNDNDYLTQDQYTKIYLLFFPTSTKADAADSFNACQLVLDGKMRNNEYISCSALYFLSTKPNDHSGLFWGGI